MPKGSSTAESAAFLSHSGFVPEDLLPAYQSICNDLLELIAQCPPEDARFRQISLHGDCHPGNVLWRDERPHFVDFDDAVRGPAIQDLWMLLSGDRHSREQQLGEILEGYEESSSCALGSRSLSSPN